MKNNLTPYIIGAFALALVTLSSCKKDSKDPEPTTPTGKLDMKFTAYAGDSLLKLDTFAYTNAAGNVYAVETFNFYISNLKLRRASDGTYFEVPESYYLFQQSSSSNEGGGHHKTTHANNFHLSGIPVGTYDQIVFSIGVDSIRNHSGAQTGWLDPVYEMLWTWSTGYIFNKFEVKALDGADTTDLIYMHIGTNAAYAPDRTYNLTTNIQIAETGKSTAAFKADVAEIMKTPTTIDLVTYTPSHGLNTTILNNYKDDMISLLSVTNTP